MYYSCILKGGNSNIEGEEKIMLAAALEESDVEVCQMENYLGFPPSPQYSQYPFMTVICKMT